MRVSLSDWVLRFLAGPPLLRDPSPLSVALETRQEHFSHHQWVSRVTIRNGHRIQLTANRPKQNTASAGSIWKLLQPPSPPKLQHRNSSAISQNIWHFSRYFKRRIYSFTISRLYSNYGLYIPRVSRNPGWQTVVYVTRKLYVRY